MGDTGKAWKTTLRALGSPQRPGDPPSDRSINFVAGQVYDHHFVSDRDTAEQFVRAFVDLYELETLSDVDDLLGRERSERRNYEGQLAFVQE